MNFLKITLHRNGNRFCWHHKSPKIIVITYKYEKFMSERKANE